MTGTPFPVNLKPFGHTIVLIKILFSSGIASNRLGVLSLLGYFVNQLTNTCDAVDVSVCPLILHLLTAFYRLGHLKLNAAWRW